MINHVLEQSEKQKDLQKRIECASSIIAPVWPLKTAIACNPLLHMEDRNFWDAFFTQKDLLSKKPNKQIEFVNAHLIKWLQVYLDQGQAYLTMPSKHLGFYRAWKELALYDDQLISTGEEKKTFSPTPRRASFYNSIFD